MATNDLPADEFFRTLTGFDEIAIAKMFGDDAWALRDEPLRFVRSLVFVDQRRNGSKDREAYQACMDMSVGELEDYFAEPVDELDPDAPETDQGKAPEPAA